VLLHLNSHRQHHLIRPDTRHPATGKAKRRDLQHGHAHDPRRVESEFLRQ
jgi:hypothetical protein